VERIDVTLIADRLIFRPRAKGLIFCFPHEKDFHPKSDFCDPTSQTVWFANQLSDDACATQAILNVLLNIQDMRLGEKVQSFKDDTADFDSVVSEEYICPSVC
jgi:ubiquitin carboxyl-terminal hydrolase L5